MQGASRKTLPRSAAALGLLLVVNFASVSAPEIEGASAVRNLEVADPTSLVCSILTVPRIITEYATCIHHTGVEDPTLLIPATDEVTPRIIVEYATGITTLDLGRSSFAPATDSYGSECASDVKAIAGAP